MGPAFWPWTQLLRRLSSFADLRPAFGDQDVGGLLDLPGIKGTPADAEQARFQLFDRVSRLLHRVAEVRPLLLLLSTARDAMSAMTPERSTLLARIAREAHQIPLARLGRGHQDGRLERRDGSPNYERLLVLFLIALRFLPLFGARAARNDKVGSCLPNVASSAASAR